MSKNSKITSKATVAMVLLSLMQFSCATQSESKAGSIIGALGGAALAALECSTRSGKKLHDCKTEAAIGLLVGGVAGYVQGTRLEKRRKEGQSDLEFIQQNNADMAKRNADLKKQNEETRVLIAEANAEAEKIRSSVASSAEKKKQFNEIAAKTKADQEKVLAAKADAEQELADQEKMLAAVQSGDFPAAEEKELQTEIASLRNQIEILGEGERELASLSSTTF